MGLSPAQWADFWINIFAGSVFFFLEVVVLAVLLPIVLDKVDRWRWRTLRSRFVRNFLEAQSIQLDIFAGKMKEASDAAKPFEVDAPRWLESCFGPPLRAQQLNMNGIRREAESNLLLYQRAVTPELHRAFITWREAVRDWEMEIESFATRGTHWVYNSSQDSDERLASIFLEIRSAFDTLSGAVQDILDTVSVRNTAHDDTRPKRELLPKRIVTDFAWDDFKVSLDTVMVAYKVASSNI